MNTESPQPEEKKSSHLSTRFGCVLLSLLFLASGVGFMALFAVRAWQDIRVFTVWQPTQCTVISLGIGAQQSIRIRAGGPRTTGSSESFRPQVTFRYVVDGIEHECTGWDSWALAGDFGGGSRKFYLRVLDRYEIGQTYPCWYDPAEPSQAVLVRRVQPLYLLAFFPMALMVLGGVGLAITFSRAKPALPPDASSASTVWQDPPGYSQRLAVRLDPVTPSTQAGCILTLAALMLAVSAFSGFAAYNSWIDGEVPVITGLSMVAFGLVGMILLWVSVGALAVRVPLPILEADQPTVAAGTRLRMRLVQPGPVRLRTIRVTFVGEIVAPAKSGAPHLKTMFEGVVIDTGPLVARHTMPFARYMDLAPPADATPSSSAEDAPEVRWRVHVTIFPFGWPRLTYLFPIIVTSSTTEPAPQDAG
ncbi:DUF3592 domain-containing protein [Desulfosarcina sp.]|uniref:DUF3592 domain-containing protein n=1 Tax=Desulfosarcina sp. TaxID=2027861 RepID=UPI003970AD93